MEALSYDKDVYTQRWFALAVVFLGVGGSFALLVALSRTPGVNHFFSSEFLFQGIVGHVILAIVLWLMSFTVMLWSFYLKGKRYYSTHIMAFVGAALITLAVFLGGGKAIPNNYVPTIDSPLFLFGLLVFFTGFSINAFGFLSGAIKGLKQNDILKSTLSVSVIVAVVMILSMALSIAMQREAAAELLFYERLFWIPGHIQQILNGALLIAVWYALKQKITGTEANSSHALLRYANWMLIASALVLFVIPFVADPVSRGSKIASEIVYAVGLGVPIFLHAVYILKGLRWKTRKEHPVAFASLALSMVIYFFGVAIAYSGLGDDLRVPAHYHGAVTGLTLAMMGFSYYMLRDIKKRRTLNRIANLQPMVYGFGMILFISGLLVSGIFGAPRKTFGVAFATDPIVISALTVMGIGTIMAVTGGVLFVLYTATSLIKETQ